MFGNGSGTVPYLYLVNVDKTLTRRGAKILLSSLNTRALALCP